MMNRIHHLVEWYTNNKDFWGDINHLMTPFPLKRVTHGQNDPNAFKNKAF
jgi:hypothetical protein